MSHISDVSGIVGLSVALSWAVTSVMSQDSQGSELKSSPVQSLVVKDFIEQFVLEMLKGALPMWVEPSQVQLSKKCDLLVTRLTQRVQEIVFDCGILYKGQVLHLQPNLVHSPFEQTRLWYGTEAFQLTGIRLRTPSRSRPQWVSAQCLYQFDSGGMTYLEGAKSCSSRLPSSLWQVQKQLQNERNSWRFHA